MKDDLELARHIHREFRRKPGSQSIASEVSLFELSKLITRIRPSHVLEFGAGIGTITALLNTHPHRPALIVSTEDNDFCIGELLKNVESVNTDGWHLVRTLDDVDSDTRFDLVIFDHTVDKEHLRRFLRIGTHCFIEGSRSFQQRAVNDAMSKLGYSVEWRRVRPLRLVLRRFKTVEILSRRFSIPHLMPFKRKKGCWIGVVKA
jgi:hypothetical protein